MAGISMGWTEGDNRKGETQGAYIWFYAAATYGEIFSRKKAQKDKKVKS